MQFLIFVFFTDQEKQSDFGCTNPVGSSPYGHSAMSFWFAAIIFFLEDKAILLLFPPDKQKKKKPTEIP